jgi:hypothetical protein
LRPSFSDQRALLAVALAEHSDGTRTDDPTIGVCWDADRLNLWRLGRKPLPRLLSTDAGRDPDTIAWARKLQGSDAERWAEACTQTYAPVIGGALTRHPPRRRLLTVRTFSPAGNRLLGRPARARRPVRPMRCDGGAPTVDDARGPGLEIVPAGARAVYVLGH